MNKATYTRRFNSLKKQLIKAYDASTEDFSSDVSIDSTASLRFGMDSCVVAHDGSLGFTIWFRQEDDSFASVEIVKANTAYTSGLAGIHIRETDLNHLMDQIDVALRDGFEKIYVHSIGKSA